MITLALSKGRILDETLPLLAAVGIELAESPETSRRLIIATSRADLRIVLVRASDVPTYVQHGGADLGVVGLDTLIEHGGEGLYRPLDLGVARCRMSVAAPLGFDYAKAARQGSRIRVATKFTRIARDHFADKGVHVDLIKLYGSMELAPLTGLADAIVDLVASGNTLKANALTEVEEIMPISARLVVNKAALKLDRERDPRHRRCPGCGGEGEAAMSIAIRRLATRDAGFDAALSSLLAYSAETDGAIEASVEAILADVRARGDAAVLDCTRRFDGIEAAALSSLEVSAAERQAALAGLPSTQRRALESAADRVRDFHERQLAAVGSSWTYRDARWHAARPEDDAARARRHLRSGRPRGVSVERADERRSGQGRGRRRDRHVRANAGRKAQSARSRRGRDLGC